jgi:transposase, IS5 family
MRKVTPARRQPPGVGTRRQGLRGQGDGTDAVQLAGLLDAPEIAQLVAELEATRWTGRPGYPIRIMVGMALAKSLYALLIWTRTVALVSEHAALRIALGCPDPISVPSVHACYRFTAKLRAFKPLLDACLDRVTAALHEQMPDLGATVAIDASDLPAYANGQRYLYKGGPERKTYSDPDASWGHRSAVSMRAAGSFYGYKLHQAVCADTGLPLAWQVETAKAQESSFAVPLLASVKARGFRPEVAVMDMGYDLTPVYEGFEAHGCHPIIPLRETPAVKAGKQRPPVCEHGEWTFAGADAKRQASKWRCPTGECAPASCWTRPTGCTP